MFNWLRGHNFRRYIYRPDKKLTRARGRSYSNWTPLMVSSNFICPESNEKASIIVCNMCPRCQDWNNDGFRECKYEYEETKATVEENERITEETIRRNEEFAERMEEEARRLRAERGPEIEEHLKRMQEYDAWEAELRAHGREEMQKINEEVAREVEEEKEKRKALEDEDEDFECWDEDSDDPIDWNQGEDDEED